MTTTSLDQALEPGFYQHYKGNVYEVLGTARHSETEEVHVVYKTCYGKEFSWIRPLSMFTENVIQAGNVIPRFRKISLAEAEKIRISPRDSP